MSVFTISGEMSVIESLIHRTVSSIKFYVDNIILKFTLILVSYKKTWKNFLDKKNGKINADLKHNQFCFFV